MTEDDTFNRLRRPNREEMCEIMLGYSREYEITGIAFELQMILEKNNWTYKEWESDD